VTSILEIPAKRASGGMLRAVPTSQWGQSIQFLLQLMNSTGSSSPRSGCCQRTSASKPVILPLVRALQLQRRQSLGMHGFIRPLTRRCVLRFGLIHIIMSGSSVSTFQVSLSCSCCWRNPSLCLQSSMLYSSLLVSATDVVL